MDQFLDRLAATTPPDRAVFIGCALVALCALLADPIVRYTRHLVTLLHEGGPAVVQQRHQPVSYTQNRAHQTILKIAGGVLSL